MKVFAPLFHFRSQESNFRITSYLSIETHTYTFRKEDKSYLSEEERFEAIDCKYWVIINKKIPKDLNPSVILNTLLLAFWIHKPTKVQTRFWFRVQANEGTVSRIMDRFLFNSKDRIIRDFDLDDLKKIAKIYSLLVRISRRRGRLQTALHNTYQGAINSNWKVAFVLYTAALEAMLTYSKGPGITKRLSKSYACIVAKKKKQRDSNFRKFHRLYNTRSDIMHGRAMRVTSAGNLKRLSELSSLLRKLWICILSDQQLGTVLESPDNVRKIFFIDIEACYSPPLI